MGPKYGFNVTKQCENNIELNRLTFRFKLKYILDNNVYIYLNKNIYKSFNQVNKKELYGSQK